MIRGRRGWVETEMYIVAAAMAPYNNFVYSFSAIPAAEEDQIEQEMMNHEVDGDAGAPSEEACGGAVSMLAALRSLPSLSSRQRPNGAV